VLVSCSLPPTGDELDRLQKENTADGEAYVERPQRIELKWGVSNNVCTVGRHPRSTILLNGKKISSNHARIWVDLAEGNVVKLEDLSTNGTYVKNQKVRVVQSQAGKVSSEQSDRARG
jgi:pSer/pThr/pTyr-binding forkhead associated (FHA) protein